MRSVRQSRGFPRDCAVVDTCVLVERSMRAQRSWDGLLDAFAVSHSSREGPALARDGAGAFQAGRRRRSGAPPELRSGLGRISQGAGAVSDPLEGLPVGQPLELGHGRVRCSMVAGGLDEILPGAREGLTGEPAGELGAGDDGVLGHAPRHSADERPGRIGGDVGVALGDRLDLTPLLGPRRVLGLQHALDLVLEFLVDPGIVLRAARGRAGELVLGLGHGASWCVGPDRCRAIGSVLVMDRWRGTHFSCSAPGRCTAVRPLFSLRTSYCGSSSLARTVRPEASVSEVIFRSTAPSAVPPWLFQVTWSPVENSSADACAMAAPPVVDRPAPALPAGAFAHTSVPAGPGSPDRGQASLLSAMP